MNEGERAIATVWMSNSLEDVGSLVSIFKTKRPRGVGVLMIKPVYQPEPIRAHDIPVFSQTIVLKQARWATMRWKSTCVFLLPCRSKMVYLPSTS